uniref:Uncharacterized protein n=1 Tax=Glossina austeni TaxID=7395 RepID=A0A1A9V099_GLOAU
MLSEMDSVEESSYWADQVLVVIEAPHLSIKSSPFFITLTSLLSTSGGSSVGWFSRIINSGLHGPSVSLYSTNLGAKINLKCTRQYSTRLALGSSRFESKTVTDQQVADAENT